MTEIEQVRADVEGLKLVLTALIGSLPDEARSNAQRYVEALRAVHVGQLLATNLTDEQIARMDKLARVLAMLPAA